MKKLLSAVVIGLSATAAQAGPSINIGTVYDYMDGDSSTYLKRVYNGGESTAFVRVNIYQIAFDATGEATETPLDNQGSSVAQRKGLVASPARLIVPAKGMQATRLLFIGERDHERYYRVRFLPVVPEKADQFDVSDSDREQYKEAMSAGVNIMTGYGSILFIRPKNTRFETNIQDGPVEYRVENAGNSTIILDEFQDCSAKNESDCQTTKKHHVRPGKVFSFAKDSDRFYRFNLVEGKAIKKIQVGK
ncbi:molecular chaperone [Pseudomonas lurida]|uniref:molecular chaperone n=1 Tax=Pseudomonas lurida TaxID=244566 RepID=UPI0027342EF6|nr:molecular chaperone [Pseudomonas lurida]WLG29635.1 molecular chaperone [Pseudomonas lurida]